MHCAWQTFHVAALRVLVAVALESCAGRRLPPQTLRRYKNILEKNLVKKTGHGANSLEKIVTAVYQHDPKGYHQDVRIHQELVERMARVVANLQIATAANEALHLHIDRSTSDLQAKLAEQKALLDTIATKIGVAAAPSVNP